MASTTLVVDDDNSVCEATIDLLRAIGFVAKGSQSAEDFLEPNHSRNVRTRSPAFEHNPSDH